MESCPPGAAQKENSVEIVLSSQVNGAAYSVIN